MISDFLISLVITRKQALPYLVDSGKMSKAYITDYRVRASEQRGYTRVQGRRAPQNVHISCMLQQGSVDHTTNPVR